MRGTPRRRRWLESTLHRPRTLAGDTKVYNTGRMCAVFQTIAAHDIQQQRNFIAGVVHMDAAGGIVGGVMLRLGTRLEDCRGQRHTKQPDR